MRNPETAGQMALWAIKLSKFNVQYRPHTTMKGLIVADFIVEFSNIEGQGVKEHPQWSIHMDGSSNKQDDGVGIVLHSLVGDEIECMVCLDFPTTNNEVEYEELVAKLDLAKAIGATSMVVTKMNGWRNTWNK